MSKVFVTQSFMPPLEEYQDYVKKIWERKYLTNQGPVLQELEAQLKAFTGALNLHYVTNGTIALQLALRALDITEGEIITTPFTYVATTSAILWERCTPVYVDINPDTLCIDADKIEAAITPRTKAILAVHVFGYPCEVEKIEAIANKHHLKVIYDAAHAFGAVYKGKSLVTFGDVSTCSFHATKLFHTIEGGAVILKDKTASEKLELLKRFGHVDDEHLCLGINGKSNEFCAAMGLCNLKHIDTIISERKRAIDYYDAALKGKVLRPRLPEGLIYNYAYYPAIFKSEAELLKVKDALAEADIFARRYFYPSLNTLSYLPQSQSCPISEDISSRIMCLPLFAGMEPEVLEKIITIIKNNVGLKVELF